ncbi:hypothetical protein EMMF5_002006 [Cystobasidiomycetes sp. EMM_F5]
MSDTMIWEHPTLGLLRGVRITPRLLQFRNIPYGNMEQRFARATIADTLHSKRDKNAGGNTVFDATRQLRTSSHQPDSVETDCKGLHLPTDILKGYEEEQLEDCLTVEITVALAESSRNAQTSSPIQPDAKARMPVLCWLHGGAYVLGAGSRPYYSPSTFLTQAVKTQKPLVYVAINYRLGSLGFFHSSQADQALMPPNNGLHDQLIAMEWLQKNISGFGGNPDDMALMGESAGSESVVIHNMSGKRQAWNRSIAFSGSLVTMPAKTPEEHEENFRSYAKKLDIDTRPERRSDDIVREMIETPIDKVRDLGFVGAPCTNSEMMPYERPKMTIPLLRPAGPHLASQIVSWSTFDGGISYNMIVANKSRKNHAALFAEIARERLKYPDELLELYNLPSITSGDASIEDDIQALRNICQFETDIGFAAPMINIAKGAPGKTFLLMFDLGNPFGEAGPLPGKEYATHAWDVVSLFGAYESRLDEEYLPIVQEYRQKIIEYAATGQDPWPAWTEEKGSASRVSRKGVEVVEKAAYMGDETQLGRLLALAEKEGGEEGADLLWERVCRAFLMHD